MRRRSFLTGTVGATAGLAGCGGLRGDGTTTASDAAGPPRLHVEGNWLAEPDGEHVALRGVNVVDPWWGTTNTDAHNREYWDTIRLATDESEGWYTDVVRVPVPPDTIAEAGLETMVEEYLDRIVELTRERGVYVILDYHAIARYDTEEIDARLREFWNRVGPRYAEESHVLYEVFNEPTQPADEGLDSWLTWRETAQPWVDLLRDHAPETPILVGSPQWSSMARFAPQAPFDGENLVYTAHVFPSWDASTWEPYFGDPALEVPMFVNEWGYVDVQRESVEPHMVGSTSGWGQPFRNWLAGHRNVNWCAWVFSSEWLPPMFDDEWNLLGGDDYMGAFVKQWLADERTRAETLTTAIETAPPKPPSVRVVTRGRAAVTIAWDSVTPSSPDPIVQYRVTVDGRDPTIFRAGERSTEITDLSPSESYEVRVVAVDAAGRSSDPTTVTVSTTSVTEPTLSIPTAPAAPTIDAAIEDLWSDLSVQAVDHWLWGQEAADVRANWRGCWDERALYVLIEVVDDTPVTDIEAAYRNDNAEIYLDLDNSRTNDYDGTDDFQLIYPRGGTVVPGSNSVSETGPIEVATTETGGGWRVETAIPWEPYGVQPERGHLLGFDVHVADNAGGEDRDGKRGWYAEEDVSWENPQSFAVVELGGPPQ